jgi:RNA-binding protein YlmH
VLHLITTSPLSEAEKQWLQNFERKLDTLVGNRTLTTAFLDPRQLELAEAVLNREKALSYTVFGGYPEAERNLLFIFPAQHQEKLPELEAIQVSWKGPAGQIGHRDLLGAVLALGLKRDQLGDIIVTEDQKAVLLVAATQAAYISSNLTEVGQVKVECEVIDLAKLPLPENEGRDMKGTVPSLRLDAVASLGFGLSRSRVVLLIKGGLARVNWRPVNSPALQLKEGDQMSLRGKGRLVLTAVEGETRKGRIHLRLKRYS